VTSSFAVFEAAIRVKSTHLIHVENQKKRNYRNKTTLYINFHLKDRSDIEFKVW